MRNFSELNINKGGRPIRRASPSKELIAEFEVKYGIKLPEGYLALLAYANGGHPELDSVQEPGREKSVRWGISRFYFIDQDRESSENLWRETEHWRPALGPTAVPFAEDGCGNPFFFDFKTSPPAIYVCIHDDNFKSVKIAPSFETLIDNLELDPDRI